MYAHMLLMWRALRSDMYAHMFPMGCAGAAAAEARGRGAAQEDDDAVFMSLARTHARARAHTHTHTHTHTHARKHAHIRKRSGAHSVVAVQDGGTDSKAYKRTRSIGTKPHQKKFGRKH